MMKRRTFLRGLGAAAAASPFLPLLTASGEEAPIKRLVLFFTPHGTVHRNWVPSGTETSFTLGPILSPLARHQSKLVVLDGLRIRASESIGAPHTKGPPLLWTASPLIEDMTFAREEPSGTTYHGWNSAPSVDQVVADAISTGLPYRSLELGVASGGNHPGHRFSYRGPERPLAPEPDPFAIYSRLFGGGSPPAERERLIAERRSVLDAMTAELNAYRGRVSVEDRAKIDAHLQSVRDVEMALGGGSECGVPDVGERFNPFIPSNVPQTLDLQFQLLAQALTCDLARVASVQYSVGENDGLLYDWIGVDREVHHLITHEDNDAARAELTLIYTWYAERFAAFLDTLDAIPEGEGTLLDHTLVVWGSELGRGWDHSFEKVPFVVAGGGATGLSTGRFLQFPGGADHNRLLVSLCNLMGLDSINTFGTTDPSSGPLPGLA